MSNPSATAPPLDWPHYGIGFVDAVKRVFQKYATFTGRASRSEFWWWYLANIIISNVLTWIAVALYLGGMNRETGAPGAGGIIFFVILGLWALAVIVPTIAVMIRRLHDAGYSGLFWLFALVGLGIIPLIMCVLQTSPNAAQYGPPPAPGYDPSGGYGQPNQGYAPPPGPPSA